MTNSRLDHQIARSRAVSLRLTCTAVLITAFATLALAQVDPRARTLMEGLQPRGGEEIRTLDQVTVITLEAEGGMEVRTRTVIDYEGRRARIDTEVAPGMSATVVIIDGEMQMRVGGMTLPMPPGVADQFGDVFDGDPNDPLADAESASYDGEVSYGELVSGEQVTVRGDTKVAGLDGGNESRFVFDARGGLLAVVGESDEGTMLMVFDEPVHGSAAVGRSATMYELRGSNVERWATIRFEDVRVNEPLDDGLF